MDTEKWKHALNNIVVGRRRNARSVGGYLALAGYSPHQKRAKVEKKEEQEVVEGEKEEEEKDTPEIEVSTFMILRLNFQSEKK